MADMRILPAGDRALVADFGNVISEEVNRRVNALKKALLAEQIEGVREMIPTYRSLLIEYDPKIIPMDDTCYLFSHIFVQHIPGRIALP